MRNFLTFRVICVIILLLGLTLFSYSSFANLRIKSYNIKDFWLRFDGESGSITDQGATLDGDDLFLLFWV